MDKNFTTLQEFKKRYPIQPSNPKMLLGSGSYGKVIKVEDQIETEWVAVKISEFKGNDTKSLKAEVELAKKVPRQANIARYDACYRIETDMGISDFAIMKYYPDGNLATLLKTTTLTNEQNNEIIRGILLGLKHLHSNRIVHRDFKPANILISRDNEGKFVPKIADFGLSKLVAEEEIESSDFDLSDGRGTPSYKAPEQIEGGRVSFNLDLWAFGVILYEMQTGEKPFAASQKTGSEDSLKREIEKKIVTVTLPEKLSTIQEPYRTIIRRCLVKDIRFRVRKADELLAILEKGVIEEKTDSYIEEKTDVINLDEKPKIVSKPIKKAIVAKPPVINKQTELPLKKIGIWVLLAILPVITYYFLSKSKEIDNTIITTPITKTENITPIEPKKIEVSKNDSKEKNDKITKEIEVKKRLQEIAIREASKKEEENLAKKVTIEHQEKQNDYNNYMQQGVNAISENNKTKAIISFRQAKNIAFDAHLDNEKLSVYYNTYLTKANRIFENEEFEGAKAWYLVAQSLKDTDEVRKKIKECDKRL